MRQARDRFDLAAEALARALEVEQFGPHDLERDAAAQRLLFGFVDHAHAAAAEPAQQAELAEPVGEVARRGRGAEQAHLPATRQTALEPLARTRMAGDELRERGFATLVVGREGVGQQFLEVVRVHRGHGTVKVASLGVSGSWPPA